MEKDKQIEALSLSVKSLGDQLNSSRLGHQRLIDKFKKQGLLLYQSQSIIEEAACQIEDPSWAVNASRFLKEVRS